MRIILLSLLLVGCATTSEPCPGPEIVRTPVWTPPKFEKPIRPVLRDIKDDATEGEVARAASLNLIDLIKYATDLEIIVNNIK